MEAAHHVNFVDPVCQTVTNFFCNLFDGKFKSMRITFLGTESAELTVENTVIGIVNVKIANEGGDIAVFTFPQNICDGSQRIHIVVLEQRERLLLQNALPSHDFVVNRTQCAG